MPAKSPSSVEAIFTAELESESPMSMMMGPITTGGNSRSMNRKPKSRMRSDMSP